MNGIVEITHVEDHWVENEKIERDINLSSTD